MAHTITIGSDSDALDLLRRLRDGDDLARGDNLRFEGWPKFELVLRGQAFKGGVPTRLMPTLIDLQKFVYSGYARVRYEDPRKRLSKQERSDLELVVYVDDSHSSLFDVNVSDVLNKIAEALTDMPATHKVVVILGIGTLVCGTYAFTHFIDVAAAEKQHELSVSMQHLGGDTALELARLVSEMANDKNEVLADQVDHMKSVTEQLLKSMEPDDRLVVGGREFITGTEGKELRKKPRQSAIDDRLDGDFLILSVDSGAVRGGFRIKVKAKTRLADWLAAKESLSVTIPEGTLDEEAVEVLKTGEWDKDAIYMEINVRRIGASIKSATLTHAGLTKR